MAILRDTRRCTSHHLRPVPHLMHGGTMLFSPVTLRHVLQYGYSHDGAAPIFLHQSCRVGERTLAGISELGCRVADQIGFRILGGLGGVLGIENGKMKAEVSDVGSSC
jgi:hypothetical protein